VAVVVIAAIALLLWLLIPRGSADARTRAAQHWPEQSATQAGNTSGESTLTIGPEQSQRAGIKIETVGERVSTEATGQQTTGVVQPNSYRETPVMSLVGGIVRSRWAGTRTKCKQGSNNCCRVQQRSCRRADEISRGIRRVRRAPQAPCAYWRS